MRSAALLLACLAGGCIVVPLPVPAHSRNPERREVLTEAQLEFLREGETTRAEVLLQLGEPDRSTPDGAALLYCWEPARALLLWGTYGAAGWALLGPDSALVLRFDEGGVLRARELAEDWFEPVREMLDAQAEPSS